MRYRGGDIRYGWRLDGDEIVANPEEQRVIDRALALRALGASLRQIAERLPYNRVGKPFHAQQVKRLLADQADRVAPNDPLTAE